MQVNDKTFEQPLSISNAINKYFAVSQLNLHLIYPKRITVPRLAWTGKKSFRFIRVNEVVLLFESIDTQPKNCQFGLDKVNTSLLSSAAPIIYSPLTYVINLSLKQGRFPDSLQITKVIQIFRQDPLFLCNNYRPI